MSPFRRNFDAETAARARLRPQIYTPDPMPAPAPPALPAHIFVIHRNNSVLADLLGCRVNIKPVGEDWHITARSADDHQRVLTLLKRRGVHGILKRKAASAV